MATLMKRPSGKWQATVRKRGRSSSKTFTKRADAVQWARELEMGAERGTLLQPLRQQSKHSLADALQRFASEISPTHRSGGREVRCIDALLKHHQSFVRLPLATLMAADVAKWRDKRLKQVAPSTVVRELTVLQSAVEHALNGNGVNMVRQVKRPRVENRRERRLQADEWQRLLYAAKCGRNNLMRPLLLFARATAMRRGELLALEWKHVDLQRFTVFLPRTKSGYSRTVPLTPIAVRVLNELRRTDPHVFPLSENAVRLAFERIRGRAQVEDVRFHDIRHNALTDFALMGLSTMELQQISGHRTTQMLARYVHIEASDLVSKLHAAE